jgi:hypothetical protein
MTTNPYAKKTNPYTTTTATSSSSSSNTNNPYTKKTTVSTSNSLDQKMPAQTNSSSLTTTITTQQQQQQWVDKYKPVHSQDILGNAEAVRQLQTWLKTWEHVFNTGPAATKNQKNLTAPGGPKKAAILSGPPGIGSKYCYYESV